MNSPKSPLTKHTILFLPANSVETDRLALGQEVRAIRNEIDQSSQRDHFELITRTGWGKSADLLYELPKLKPTVIHFSGNGRARLLESSLSAAGSSVKLVVLSACYTEVQAEAVLAHVPCVVGVHGAMHRTEAMNFVAAFYRELADGGSVAAAYLRGCDAIDVESMPVGDRPQLKFRDGVDAHILDASEATVERVSAQRDVGWEQPSKDLPNGAGRNLIAVIGIDRYRYTQQWRRLSHAVSDACGAAALFGDLGFVQATPALLDDAATGRAIQSLVSDDRMALGADDSLVLFYAGHGGNRQRRIGNREVNNGYLIPVDAEHTVATWVDLDGWLRDVATLPPRHILVILDACHSGIALDPVIKWRDSTSWRGEPASLRTRQSRKIITSALSDERAMDSGPYPGHSLFTGCLIDVLTHWLRQKDEPVTTGTELGLQLRHRVSSYPNSQQTPDFGAFAFDERGEMVISLPREPRPIATPNASEPHQRMASGSVYTVTSGMPAPTAPPVPFFDTTPVASVAGPMFSHTDIPNQRRRERLWLRILFAFVALIVLFVLFILGFGR